MTNEEAKQFLDNMKREEAGRGIGAEGFYAELIGYHIQALNMAIKALEHEQALGEAFNIALLYGKEKGMEAIDKALYQMGMDGIKEQEIKALEQDPKTEWISVSERLPEKDELYLVYFDDGEYELVYFSNGVFSYSGVVAWMPLPEPYKEVSE